MEGLFLLKILLPKISVCVFDFIGSGYSEGEYITLGQKEARDTLSVIEYLKKNYDIDKIVLWGRSMGAVTSILAAEN